MPRFDSGHFEKDARKHFAKERFKQHRNFYSEKAGFKLEEVKQNGGSAAEFTSVTDRVYKNINPSHNWFPTVTKIQLIHNPPLQLKFEEAKLKSEIFFVFVGEQDGKLWETFNEVSSWSGRGPKAKDTC